MPALPATAAPLLVCRACGGASRRDPSHLCEHCAAPLQVLEPLFVDCGWCGTANPRHETAACRSCGGPLPPLPTGQPGPRPPETPRALPPGYRWRVLLWKNTMAFIGAAFVIVFCWSVIFPIIGAPLWYFGHRKAKRWLAALEHGTATRGRLTKVALDLTQSHNNAHPWRIEYAYDLADGTTGTGFVEAWDKVNGARHAGDGVWVVVGELDGVAVSAIWPPLH